MWNCTSIYQLQSATIAVDLLVLLLPCVYVNVCVLVVLRVSGADFCGGVGDRSLCLHLRSQGLYISVSTAIQSCHLLNIGLLSCRHVVFLVAIIFSSTTATNLMTF